MIASRLAITAKLIKTNSHIPLYFGKALDLTAFDLGLVAVDFFVVLTTLAAIFWIYFERD